MHIYFLTINLLKLIFYSNYMYDYTVKEVQKCVYGIG